MCQLKSCLVLKDRVFCPPYDAHQKMLEQLKIKDNETNALHTFVRIELLPPDHVYGLSKPLNEWILKVEQDMRPDWWDEAIYRPMIEEAVEVWRRKYVLRDGEHHIASGMYYALGNAEVWAQGSAMIYAYGNAKVVAYNSVTVIAHDNVAVSAYNKVDVKAFDDATVRAYDTAMVSAYNDVRAEFWGKTSAQVYDNVKVKAQGGAIIKAYNNAQVEARGLATVLETLLSQIIYPAGQTAETHG